MVMRKETLLHCRHCIMIEPESKKCETLKVKASINGNGHACRCKGHSWGLADKFLLPPCVDWDGDDATVQWSCCELGQLTIPRYVSIDVYGDLCIHW